MSGIIVSKAAQRFVPANQRHACKSCNFGSEQRADRMPPYDTVTWRCTKGGFYVTAMSICNDYISKRSAT